MAFGVLDYARSQMMNVPADLSVTGFDGVELARIRELTTVAQPNREKGRAAGAMLGELIDAHAEDHPRPDPAPRRILATSFLPGATLAPPRL